MIWRVYLTFWSIKFFIVRIEGKEEVTVGVMMILGMQIILVRWEPKQLIAPNWQVSKSHDNIKNRL